jgi:hypothetical protein
MLLLSGKERTEMNYTLMHKTTPVLRLVIDGDTGTISGVGEAFSPEHLPVGIPHSDGRKALNDWWTGRAIPASRSGLREALETLRISSPQLLLTKCYGLSLSDQYWVRPENSGLRWEDINFFDHTFSEDVGNILFGEARDGEGFDLVSPDNTSDGWLQKKWIIADGKRCLVKGGSGATRQEPYNEVLASLIMERLGIPHSPYTLAIRDEYPYSVCEDFITAQTELVSAWHILQTRKQPNHVSLYRHYLDCCGELGIPGIVDALDRMLTVDYIIANEDRHLNNFGAVRNADTLEWTGAAPVFDCGTSMWCLKPTTMIRPLAKLPSKPFKKDHAEQIGLVTSFDWLDIDALYGVDEAFSEILRGSDFIDGPRRDALCYGLRKRVEMLGETVKQRNDPSIMPKPYRGRDGRER